MRRSRTSKAWKAWKSWKRARGFSTYAFWFFLAVVGIPLLIQEGTYAFHLLLRIRPLQVSTKAYLQTFLDDQAMLANEPFFQLRLGTKNAAPYLNFRLDWAPPTPSLVRQLSANPPKITLPTAMAQQIKGWGAQFPKYHPRLDYQLVDFTWMNEILTYDYWDFIEPSTAEEVFETQSATALYFTQPHAKEFEQLVLVAKARLMRGLHDGDLESAVKEARHFAKLLYSTETLMGAMASIAILRAERNVYDYLQKNIQTGVGDWEPMERAMIDRARRATLAFNAMMTVFTPSDVLDRVFLDSNIHVGLCSALAKGMLRGLLTRPLLEPQFPLERNFEQVYEDIDDVMEGNDDRCRLSHFKTMWKGKRSRLVWLGVVGENSWDWINLHLIRHVPLLRRAWGIDLSSVYLSNGFDSYEDPLN